MDCEGSEDSAVTVLANFCADGQTGEGRDLDLNAARAALMAI